MQPQRPHCERHETADTKLQQANTHAGCLRLGVHELHCTKQHFIHRVVYSPGWLCKSAGRGMPSTPSCWNCAAGTGAVSTTHDQQQMRLRQSKLKRCMHRSGWNSAADSLMTTSSVNYQSSHVEGDVEEVPPAEQHAQIQRLAQRLLLGCRICRLICTQCSGIRSADRSRKAFPAACALGAVW